MGLGVYLEDENARRLASIEDPKNILHRVLKDLPPERFLYLRDIDWYGNTLFNRLQMKRLKSELADRRSQIYSAEEEAMISAISELVEKCANSVHLYIRFWGD